MYRLIGEIKCLNNLVLRKLGSDETLKTQEEISGCKGYILGFIVRKIKEGQEIYQRDLEKAFSLRRSSATQILTQMEKNGLIIRQSQEEDKRLKKIIVTEKGLKSHQTVIDRLEEIDKKLISCLTQEEIEIFKSVANKLKEALDK